MGKLWIFKRLLRDTKTSLKLKAAHAGICLPKAKIEISTS
jgi:hypothetical protein